MALRLTEEFVRGSLKGFDRPDDGQPRHSERSRRDSGRAACQIGFQNQAPGDYPMPQKMLHQPGGFLSLTMRANVC